MRAVKLSAIGVVMLFAAMGATAARADVLPPQAEPQKSHFYWPWEEKPQPRPLQPLPPVREEELSQIPGERRVELEGQCTAQAMQRAAEMQVDTDAFLSTNKDYINQCIMRLLHHAAARERVVQP